MIKFIIIILIIYRLTYNYNYIDFQIKLELGF